jgi:N-methylhydantoinase A/oxoprolinase/acetone carboxylase beta subunit
MAQRIAGGPIPLPDLVASRRDNSTLQRLVGRGAVIISAFTPSDAAHLLGLHAGWDREAAKKAAGLFARKRTRLGDSLAGDAEEISTKVIAAVTKTSSESILDASFAEDGELTPRPSAHPLVQAALGHRQGLVRLGLRLSVPIVALGAAAGTYYPEVARQLDTTAVIPSTPTSRTRSVP